MEYPNLIFQLVNRQKQIQTLPRIQKISVEDLQLKVDDKDKELRTRNEKVLILKRRSYYTV